MNNHIKIIRLMYFSHMSVTAQIQRYQILSSLGFPFRVFPQSFKTCMLGEGFHTLINGGLFSSPINVGHHNPPPLRGPTSSLALFPSSNRCGTAPKSTPLWAPASLLAHRLVSTPLRGTARRLAHRPMSGSDTICNGPDPPLADNVLFGLSLSGFPSKF